MLHLLAACTLLAAPTTRLLSSDDGNPQKPVALPLLVPDGTRLKLQPAALEYLAALRGPVAVVAAIGQYRSGKSFLLNQLMRMSCDEGFKVGHQRETQTKGVWLLAAPAGDGSSTLLYLDTEGFEGTGKAAAYDDRIFAFAALVSSALLYNLVETIKQGDIQKLSFAAQLAREFWRRAGRGDADGGGGGGGGGARAAAAAVARWRARRFCGSCSATSCRAARSTTTRSRR